MPSSWLSLFALLLCALAVRGEDLSYRKPPQDVLAALRAPEIPDASISPAADAAILLSPVKFPPLSELAQPWLSLAGVRVAPRNRSIGDPLRNGESTWSAYTLLDLATGGRIPVALPKDAKVGWPLWSADGKRYAFSRITDTSVELWLGKKGSPEVRRVEGLALNRMLECGFQWMPDQKTLIAKAVPENLGPSPAIDGVPSGPSVQESSGDGGPSSTYEAMNVLRNPDDERLFDHYALSRLVMVDAATGRMEPYGAPGLYGEVSPSPDGRFLLLEALHRPYSHLTTYERFPRRIEIRDREGRLAGLVADRPLMESVPIRGVETGPRDISWRPDQPATLFLTEALDGGNLDTKADRRDRAMSWKAPFEGTPSELFRTENRLEGILFGPFGDRALVTEYDAIRHWRRTWLRHVDAPSEKPRLVWDMSTDERYADPGSPLRQTRPDGTTVWLQDGNSLFLKGSGATPQGDRPFLDRLDLGTLATERLFRSDDSAYEEPLAWLDVRSRKLLTRRESPRDPPDLVVRTLERPNPSAKEEGWISSSRTVAHFDDPTPILRQVEKRLVKYKRADGLDLSFTLYLPPGRKVGERLPAVLYAYPLDYTEARTAAQVGGSPRRFARFGRSDQLYFLLRGYAVLDNVQMPIVGESSRMYDDYLPQLIEDARAAVSAAGRTGAVDTARIGAMGHSHGGLMVANLLAHTRLFRAGIARSGSYNKTLTAFGFQHETRPLWQAPEVYARVSPFFSADSIKDPLLIVHGASDANPGTAPIQSEMLYQAVRGNGGTVRLVMLPLESHGYRSLESNEHVLSEELDWFDRYVR